MAQLSSKWCAFPQDRHLAASIPEPAATRAAGKLALMAVGDVPAARMAWLAAALNAGRHDLPAAGARHLPEFAVLSCEQPVHGSRQVVSFRRERAAVDVDGMDCLAVTCGDAPPDTFATASLALLVRAAGHGLPLIGIGTGVFALAAAGLLSGRRCVVVSRHRPRFAELFPDSEIETDVELIADGPILTCLAGGRSTLAAVGRIATQDLAVAAGPAVGQQVARAIQLMRQNIGEPISIGDIAGRVGLPVRQLTRRFLQEVEATPAALYRRIRLEQARASLLQTRQTVTAIAFDCGFSDAAHLTRSFKAHFGDLPSAYRSAARRQGAAAAR
ncbi:MAG: helix-turn-helix domain-containing protein [Amaricoccus sp.]|uniref:GlxA family transcriptional regulator n=1 Tax=Amaricoccus sp. TaxID=1872485 RepID=UPI0039E6A179